MTSTIDGDEHVLNDVFHRWFWNPAGSYDPPDQSMVFAVNGGEVERHRPNSSSTLPGRRHAKDEVDRNVTEHDAKEG